MESPLTRFSATVADYRRFRPGYPKALWAWIEEQAGASAAALRTLDLGCGTGITTAGFADRGQRVTGLDPNAGMLTAAREDVPTAGFVRGRGERLPFVADAFDLATGGQCFHWFDLEATVPELDRVVRPGGLAVAFWNTRGRGPFERGYDELIHEVSAEFRAVRGSKDTLADLDRLVAGRGPQAVTLPNHQDLDLEAFLGRVRSSSYVVHGVEDVPALERRLESLFHAHQRNGQVRLHYDLVVRSWRCG